MVRTFFWYSIIVKSYVDVSIIRFYFSFYDFWLYARLLPIFFWIMSLTFFQILLYFSSNLSFLIFIKTDIHLVLSKSLPYALIFGKNILKVYFFNIFRGNQIFKIVYYYFINIYIIYRSIILYWWNLYFSISVSSKFIFLYPFL